MRKRVLSGIQPSGSVHLGNYLGAIQNWVRSQDEYDNFFCVVDLHAITVPQNPQQLKKNIRELAGVLFACGIDPEKSALFVQSDVSQHAELAWILNCFTPMGWMNRMTQFKDKSAKQKDEGTVGLFDYPVLMAADILIYDTDIVPVGEDQKQHIEITRDIAQKFNFAMGETFKMPEPVIPKIGARIMGLDDPEKKMSKSEDKKNHALYLLDSPDDIRQKCARATTDSLKDIRFDESRPAIYNLLTIYQLMSGESREVIESRFAGKGYGDFKKALAEVIIEKIKPVQEAYLRFAQDPAELDRLLKQGADRARMIADAVLTRVKQRVGLGS